MNYFQRYQNGQHRDVWQALHELGADVTKEPLKSEAQAVAGTTMRRAQYNIALLSKKLTVLGYQFPGPIEADIELGSQEYYGWYPANTITHALVKYLETTYGALPFSIAQWFTVVGFVNFTGYHPAISTYAALGIAEPITYADPLVVQYYEEPYMVSANDRNGEQPSPRYELALAPCYFHKSNYSGSGSIKICVPKSGMDTTLIDDSDKWTGVAFIEHLRRSFQWGGFPGFAEHSGAQDASKDVIAYLTKGLVAL